VQRGKWCRREALQKGSGAGGKWCRREVVQEGSGAGGKGVARGSPAPILRRREEPRHSLRAREGGKRRGEGTDLSQKPEGERILVPALLEAARPEHGELQPPGGAPPALARHREALLVGGRGQRVQLIQHALQLQLLVLLRKELAHHGGGTPAENASWGKGEAGTCTGKPIRLRGQRGSRNVHRASP